jgi:hypothetical protein
MAGADLIQNLHENHPSGGLHQERPAPKTTEGDEM